MDGAGLRAKVGNRMRQPHFAAQLFFREEERVAHVLVFVGDGYQFLTCESARFLGLGLFLR